MAIYYLKTMGGTISLNQHHSCLTYANFGQRFLPICLNLLTPIAPRSFLDLEPGSPSASSTFALEASQISRVSKLKFIRTISTASHSLFRSIAPNLCPGVTCSGRQRPLICNFHILSPRTSVASKPGSRASASFNVGSKRAASNSATSPVIPKGFPVSALYRIAKILAWLSKLIISSLESLTSAPASLCPAGPAHAPAA